MDHWTWDTLWTTGLGILSTYKRQSIKLANISHWDYPKNNVQV